MKDSLAFSCFSGSAIVEEWSWRQKFEIQRLCGGHGKEEVLLKLPLGLGMLHDFFTSSIAPASWLEHLHPG